MRYFSEVDPDGTPLVDYRMTVDDEAKTKVVERFEGDPWVSADSDLLLGRLERGDPMLVEFDPEALIESMRPLGS
jgi:hypothetical protein